MEYRKCTNHLILIMLMAIIALNFSGPVFGSVPEKLRVIMMSDFPPIGVVKEGNVPNTQKGDPDDMQSMVRFLLYANEFDVEGLVAGAGTFAMEAHKENMLDVLDRYEMVYENLKSYDPEYPTANYLRSVTYEGLGNNHGLSIQWGSNTQPVTDIIGEGKDSEASNAIIAAADKPDPRPIYIGVWGTPREVSQAIWRVRKDRSEEEFKAFISKLRIFLIAYQDCTHSWLMDEFPELFIIESRKTYQGFFGGSDQVSNLAWVNENIRNNHGPLCDIYPHEGMGCTGVCEGDSPAFMYLVSANRGINDPEDPTQKSWGGQYVRKANTNHYVDGPGGSSISEWRKDFQKEFAERADWCVEPASTGKAKLQKLHIINTTDLGADSAIEKSINDIIGKMTLEEKVKFIGGTGFVADVKIGETLPIERLGLPAVKMTDATLGSKMTKGATLFPAYICQAAAFNPSLAYEYGNAVAEQCIADGYRILLGPGVNIYRVPNCGRNFEYSGEDPYLAAQTVAEYAKAVQQAGVIATVKHYISNNTEYYRSNSNSIVSERALREIYMPAFKAAVQQGGVKAVMTSYNLINGQYAAENKWLVTDVLRGEWGFKGLVMTDWWGSHNTDPYIAAGTDLEMPQPNVIRSDKLMPLINNGTVTEGYLNERVSNILRPCLEMGLFDKPQQDESMRNNWPKHAEVAKKIAREGLVLLKNQNVLPLNRNTVKTIALVGSNAEKTVSTGGGAAGFDPGADFITYAAAIKKTAGPEVKIFTATPEQAKDADVALVFATMLEHENMDRPFAFQEDTVKMIKDTAASNEKTVVIVSLGGSVDMMPWIKDVEGLIYAWYPGTYGAVALGEVIFGDINPSGKLPITLEKRPEDTHYFGNHLPDEAKLGYVFPGWNTNRSTNYDVHYREGVLVGYRWFDTKNIEPLYPFGYGLSYTTFEFSDLKLSQTLSSYGKSVDITFKLKNTGSVDGAEVAQLYIQDVESSVIRPLKELKGFKKVFLSSGQTKTVKFTVNKDDLSFWDEETKAWKAEPGAYKLHIGTSSRDIELTRAIFMVNQQITLK